MGQEAIRVETHLDGGAQLSAKIKIIATGNSVQFSRLLNGEWFVTPASPDSLFVKMNPLGVPKNAIEFEVNGRVQHVTIHDGSSRCVRADVEIQATVPARRE